MQYILYNIVIEKYTKIINKKFSILNEIFNSILLISDYSDKLYAKVLSFGEDMSSDLMELCLIENKSISIFASKVWNPIKLAGLTFKILWLILPDTVPFEAVITDVPAALPVTSTVLLSIFSTLNTVSLQ